MILKAQITPYSSIVGGGLTLVDENERARFMVMLIGTDSGITKQESDEIASQLARLINERGISVAAREDARDV